MSFDGRAFLGLAHTLTNTLPNTEPAIEEAQLRSAISRAYYALFWVARARLIAEGERIPRLDAHQIVIDRFRNSPYRARVTIGFHLANLRTDRNEADYKITSERLPQLRTKAIGILDRATSLLTRLDQLP